MAAKKPRTAGKRAAAQKRRSAPKKKAPAKKALQKFKRGLKRAVSKVKKALRKVAPKKAKAPRSRRAKPAARKRTTNRAKPVRAGAATKRTAAAKRTAEPRAPAWLAREHAPVDDLTSSGNELLDIFQRYDRDRSGQINRAEFARLLEALGQEISDEELEVALDVVDADHSGRISWGEFKDWWTGR